MKWKKRFFQLSGGSRGSQSNTWSTTETWKYITREGKWVTVAPMLRPRTNHSSATLNGEIYVIGGKKTNQFLTGGFRQMILGQCRTGHLSFHWQGLQWILSKLNITTHSVIAGLLRGQRWNMWLTLQPHLVKESFTSLVLVLLNIMPWLCSATIL